jgi:hypothetical protein
MAGLVPAIHVLPTEKKGVDARSSPGMTRYPQGLLARGGGVHVDFHANGDFDDLWGFPGHCFLAWVNCVHSAKNWDPPKLRCHCYGESRENCHPAASTARWAMTLIRLAR